MGRVEASRRLDMRKGPYDVDLSQAAEVVADKTVYSFMSFFVFC